MSNEDARSLGNEVHARRDAEKLRYHQVVAEHLGKDPERVLAIAWDNLRRWLCTDRDSKPYYEEWERILGNRAPQEIMALITADTTEGRRLRQSSPFVGVLSVAEREDIFAPR